jgi:hypothetical protein
MTINRTRLAALTAALILFPGGTLSAGTLLTIDLSANVSEANLPGGTVFQDAKPLFDVPADPKQSAELLHLSTLGVNASGRSTNISAAFASSLAESDGNGGVGVSQLIFGSPGGSGQDTVRQLVAQSLWTDTFVYNGPPAHDILHLHLPTLQVGLLGVPPRRTGLSASETAEASARVDEVITHPDGTMAQGLFQYGLREFEKQIPSGSDLLNLTDTKLLEHPDPLTFTPTLRFNGDDFNPSYTLDPVSLDIDLGVMQPGDTMSWVYTLTAQGTTHGFERGYFAFFGDPFGQDVITDNLTQTICASSDAPEAGTCALMLLGFTGLFVKRRHRLQSRSPFHNSLLMEDSQSTGSDTIKGSFYGQRRDSPGRLGASLLGAAKDSRCSPQAARPAGNPATDGPGQRSMAPACPAPLEKPLAFHGPGFDHDAQRAGRLRARTHRRKAWKRVDPHHHRWRQRPQKHDVQPGPGIGRP